MKRQERLYGCTFLACNKSFGSKNDWKRHENAQYFHLGVWRCTDIKADNTPCTKVCYRRSTFQEHLKKDHCIVDDQVIKTKTENCKIGRNCQIRFWCGFCGKSVDLKRKGLEAWTERFDHIDDHFMGRNVPKQSIKEWIPVDSDKPKGEVASPPVFAELGSNKESEGSISDSSNSGKEGSSTAINLEAQVSSREGRRFAKVEESESSRLPKQGKTAEGFQKSIFCCKCGALHNPAYRIGCTCYWSHRWCKKCRIIDGLERNDPEITLPPTITGLHMLPEKRPSKTQVEYSWQLADRDLQRDVQPHKNASYNRSAVGGVFGNFR